MITIHIMYKVGMLGLNPYVTNTLPYCNNIALLLQNQKNNGLIFKNICTFGTKCYRKRC
jgi:hypothetical protein